MVTGKNNRVSTSQERHQQSGHKLRCKIPTPRLNLPGITSLSLSLCPSAHFSLLLVNVSLRRQILSIYFATNSGDDQRCRDTWLKTIQLKQQPRHGGDHPEHKRDPTEIHRDFPGRAGKFFLEFFLTCFLSLPGEYDQRVVVLRFGEFVS